MSSAENDTRPVWLTREQRDLLEALGVQGLYRDLATLPEAWDAAPADPAEAVAVALEEADGRATLNTTIFDIADAVLAALGMPKEA